MLLLSGRLIVVLGFICYLGRLILLWIKYKNQKQVFWLKEVIVFLFVIYICMVVSVTLFPIPIGFHSNTENIYRSINVMPLVSIIKSISQIGIAYGGDAQFMIGLIVRNVGGNILLLMPLSFLAPLIWNKFKRFKNIMLLGFVISVSIELLQLVETMLSGGWGRITDINDVICNVLGVTVGYLIYKFTFKLIDHFQIKILQKLNSGRSELFDKNNEVEI
ncbi:VanZ family protein [Neobacillus ginsengisoli]|nr:VanZ family protein [Neobacillus ginsengisoli]